MKLRNLFNITKGDIVSITGAGGKTSLMFALAEECREDRVLVTTSTKVYKPKEDQYDYLSCNSFKGAAFDLDKNSGIYVVCSHINEENKLTAINENDLNFFHKYFDYVFIEADGAKGKLLKGWRENEPVIFKGTTKTVGILNIKAVGLTVNENCVHRVDRFREISGLDLNQKIEIENIVNMVLHPKGLFKNYLGEKILFINGLEGTEDIDRTRKLIQAIRREDSRGIVRIIAGNLKSKFYKPM